MQTRLLINIAEKFVGIAKKYSQVHSTSGTYHILTVVRHNFNYLKKTDLAGKGRAYNYFLTSCLLQ